MSNVIKLHGMLSYVVLDRDKVFTSSFLTNLFKLQRTTLNMCFVYHPLKQMVNVKLYKCLEMYLRYLTWAKSFV